MVNSLSVSCRHVSVFHHCLSPSILLSLTTFVFLPLSLLLSPSVSLFPSLLSCLSGTWRRPSEIRSATCGSWRSTRRRRPTSTSPGRSRRSRKASGIAEVSVVVTASGVRESLRHSQGDQHEDIRLGSNVSTTIVRIIPFLSFSSSSLLLILFFQTVGTRWPVRPFMRSAALPLPTVNVSEWSDFLLDTHTSTCRFRTA